MIAPSAQLGSSVQLRAYRPDLAGRTAQGEALSPPTARTQSEESEVPAAGQPQDVRKGQRLDIYG
jgi:hypothetical protein